jgi:hypothetical protein
MGSSTADSPVIDITRSQIGFNVVYTPDDDPAKPPVNVPVKISPVSAALVGLTVSTPLGLQPVLQTLEQIPKTFTGLWNSSLQFLQTTVTAQLDNIFGKGKYSASKISAPLPQIRARVIPTTELDWQGSVYLDCWVPGMTLDLHITIHTNLGDTGLDLRITADMELFVAANFFWPAVYLYSSAGVYNASIGPKPGSGTAHTWDIIVLEVDSDYPTPMSDLISGYEMQVNAIQVPAPDVSIFAAAFSSLAAAAMPLGLVTIEPRTNNNQLIFDLIHPVDLKPVAFDAQSMLTVRVPKLSGVALTTPAQATPGGQISVNGTNFPPSNFVSIGWTNTSSGKVVSSLVQWENGGPPTKHLITWATPPNQQSIFMLPQVQPAPQVYNVQAQNSDALTTTPFSPAIPLQALGELVLVLAYQSSGRQATPTSPSIPAGSAMSPLTTVSVGVNGGFTCTVTIPPDAVANSSATLFAQASGQSIASASFNIVGKLIPVIYLVDPTSSTNAGWPSGVNRGYSVAVRGENFPVPSQVGITINQSNEQSLVGQGDADITNVNQDGTFNYPVFIWPSNDPAGSYNLIANKINFDLAHPYDPPAFLGVEAILAVTEETPLQ